MAISNNAKFSVSALTGRISPGEMALVTVTYSPTDESIDSGYIIVTHDGDSSPDSVMVEGTGSLNIISEGFDGPWVGDPAAPAGWTVVNSDGDGYTWTQANTYISFDVATDSSIAISVVEETYFVISATAKFKVYVNTGKKNADGTIRVKKVNFGQKGVKIKKNNPARRRSFRARHNCDNPGPKTKARYWSCRKW